MRAIACGTILATYVYIISPDTSLKYIHVAVNVIIMYYFPSNCRKLSLIIIIIVCTLQALVTFKFDTEVLKTERECPSLVYCLKQLLYEVMTFCY